MRRFIAVAAAFGAHADVDSELLRQRHVIDELLLHQEQLEAHLSLLEARNLRSQGRRLEVTPNATNATAKVVDVPQEDPAAAGLALCLDFMWLLVAGALVMFMQAGFAILEAGSVREKNAGTVLLKNIIDVCVGTIVWWLLGYGLAYGVSDSPNNYFGVQNFAGSDFLTFDSQGVIAGSNHPKDWFFQWAFCATCATIISGGVAERIQLPAYIVLSVVMTGFIYPVVVYWTWSGKGWLTEGGYDDFAGSGIVHLTGGVASLVASCVVGPRAGRFSSEDSNRFSPHNMGMVVLGTFILWFGWYGFNCGSTLSFSSPSTAVAAGLVAMNTTVAAASGGIIVGLLRFVYGLATRGKFEYDLAGMCNGILVGLVSVCAGALQIRPEYAVLTAVLGGFAHEVAHHLLLLLKIDDPLDAFAVHACGGMVGLLTRPLFDYTGANIDMWGWHWIGMFAIIAWSGGLTFVTLLPFKLTNQLTASEAEQEKGGDVHHMSSGMYRQTTKTVEAPV